MDILLHLTILIIVQQGIEKYPQQVVILLMGVVIGQQQSMFKVPAVILLLIICQAGEEPVGF